MSKRAKKQEQIVADALLADGFLFQREVRINYNCFQADKKFARLDFVLEMPSKRVVLEVDEFQHKKESYNVSCDASRMTDVMSALACEGNERPTMWIRFNPDAYTVDGVPVRTRRKDRLKSLCALLRDAPSRPLQIVYCFYDTVGGVPAITLDNAYSPALRGLVEVLGSRFFISHKK